MLFYIFLSAPVGNAAIILRSRLKVKVLKGMLQKNEQLLSAQENGILPHNYINNEAGKITLQLQVTQHSQSICWTQNQWRLWNGEIKESKYWAWDKVCLCLQHVLACDKYRNTSVCWMLLCVILWLWILCVCIKVLNEVVVDRGPSSYLSNVDLYLDGRLITSVQGDGEHKHTLQLQTALIDPFLSGHHCASHLKGIWWLRDFQNVISTFNQQGHF